VEAEQKAGSGNIKSVSCPLPENKLKTIKRDRSFIKQLKGTGLNGIKLSAVLDEKTLTTVLGDG
jgi:hypothetical protein